MKAIKLRVYGKVQNVGFRVFISKVAQELGIRGYVKNEDQGSVLVYGVGEEDKIDELIKITKKGSERSKIELVEVRDAEIISFMGFDVRN
jgi:acylphosphatase